MNTKNEIKKVFAKDSEYEVRIHNNFSELFHKDKGSIMVSSTWKIPMEKVERMASMGRDMNISHSEISCPYPRVIENTKKRK